MSSNTPTSNSTEPQPAGEAECSSRDDEPMNADQIAQLKALSIQINDPQAFSIDLTQAEADARIKMLEAALAR